MGRRSFPAWNEHALVEAGRIDGLADSAERLNPLLAVLALIEEVLDRGFDELTQIPVLAGGQFILDPIFASGDRFTSMGVPRVLILRQIGTDRE